uniref:Uncharacterized protein n=1 Tax=Coturnix japonica TaxID=93934 RepID=A0A8C2Y5W4_COTJA
IGMLGRLDTVQSKHNLMIPEQRSLNLFTRNPPRNVPPPPAGTTRYTQQCHLLSPPPPRGLRGTFMSQRNEKHPLLSKLMLQ